MTQPSPAALFSYLVRPAGPDDAEALAHVLATSWRETYGGLLPKPFTARLLPDAVLARMSQARAARRFRHELGRPGPQDVVLAAFGLDGLFGYVAGGPSRHGVVGEAEINNLYVLRLAHGRGVGRRLLTDAVRAMAAQGATSLIIRVFADNAPARGFYERLGGLADPPVQRPSRGVMMSEVDYRWADLGRLID